MLQLGAAVPFRKRVPYFVALEGLWSVYTHHDRLCVCVLLDCDCYYSFTLSVIGQVCMCVCGLAEVAR